MSYTVQRVQYRREYFMIPQVHVCFTSIQAEPLFSTSPLALAAYVRPATSTYHLAFDQCSHIRNLGLRSARIRLSPACPFKFFPWQDCRISVSPCVLRICENTGDNIFWPNCFVKVVCNGSCRQVVCNRFEWFAVYVLCVDVTDNLGFNIHDDMFPILDFVLKGCRQLFLIRKYWCVTRCSPSPQSSLTIIINLFMGDWGAKAQLIYLVHTHFVISFGEFPCMIPTWKALSW